MWKFLTDAELVSCAIASAAGSFLRESALLRNELERQEGRRLLVFAFFPLWIVCGGTLGTVLGTGASVSAPYLIVAGAAWRKIATDGQAALRIVRDVLNAIDQTPNGETGGPQRSGGKD